MISNSPLLISSPQLRIHCYTKRDVFADFFLEGVQFINSIMFTIKMYKLMNTSSRLVSPNRRVHTTLWKYVVLQRQIQFQFHFQFMFMAIFRALLIFRNFDIYKVVKDPKTYPMKFHILWPNGLVVIATLFYGTLELPDSYVCIYIQFCPTYSQK